MYLSLSIVGLLLQSALSPVALPPAPQADTRAEIANEIAGGAGLKVAVDRTTGRIIAEPTAADLEGLAGAARFELEGGGTGVFLDGWAEHSLVVRRDANGRLRAACAAGDDHGHRDERDREPMSARESLR